MIVIFGTIILLGITVNLFSHWKGSSGILGKKQDVGKETGIKTEAKFKELDDRYSHSFFGLLLVFSIMMIMSARGVLFLKKSTIEWGANAYTGCKIGNFCQKT